jgi:hypothetical protein
MKMKSYILEHINELENFCTQNNITVESVLNSPKSFNKNTMYILHQDAKTGENGLNDETPAEVLLIIQKKDNKLEFLPKTNLKKYLS